MGRAILYIITRHQNSLSVNLTRFKAQRPTQSRPTPFKKNHSEIGNASSNLGPWNWAHEQFKRGTNLESKKSPQKLKWLINCNDVTFLVAGLGFEPTAFRL